MDESLAVAIPLMAGGISAGWWTSVVRVVTSGQVARYILLHRSDNPDQQFLIKSEPDLRLVRGWMLNRLSRRPEQWHDVHAAVRPE